MRISIVCSDTRHPVRPFLESWRARNSSEHHIELVERVSGLSGGELLFLISCHDIVTASTRARYARTLVIHASDLPNGRGWSPHIWQILEGKNEFRVTLLEAEDEVDTGAIWAQTEIHLEGHELLDEINARLFEAELRLMDAAVAGFRTITPRAQDAKPGSYYRRRVPEDSRLDPEKSIADQFDLLRVADAKRYPAFFDFRGERYFVQISKNSLVEG